MPIFDNIITKGNRRYLDSSDPNWVECKDGFRMSVVAGFGSYSIPRMEAHQFVVGPFTHVEVGFPSLRPEPWDEWSRYVNDDRDPTETVYSQVPVEMVRSLIELHGGEV